MPTDTPPFVSASCEGETCGVCGDPAVTKVGEEIMHDDPMPHRHNLTQYLCRTHATAVLQPYLQDAPGCPWCAATGVHPRFLDTTPAATPQPGEREEHPARDAIHALQRASTLTLEALLNLKESNDTLTRELAEAKRGAALFTTPRPREEWHEDDGPALWWMTPHGGYPYAGTPNDDDWPGDQYCTHWTPIPAPDFRGLAALAPAQEGER